MTDSRPIVDWAGTFQGSEDEEVLLLLEFDLDSKAGRDIGSEHILAVDADCGLELVRSFD